MLSTSEAGKVFDTVLSIPGMNETVKIDLKISRKNVLLLSHVLERGLAKMNEDGDAGLLSKLPRDTFAELNQITTDCLQKAGLSELNEKLKSLSTK